MNKRTQKEEDEMIIELGLVKCQCGYYNKKKYVNVYGTCRGCGKVLDLKAKFRFESEKKNGGRYKCIKK